MKLGYSDYLKKRSIFSYLYRNYYLYPKIKKFCSRNFLDVGCGIGDFLNYMKTGTGVDIDEENIKYCKSLNLNAKIMKVDQLDFNDNFFETVILDNVLEHIQDPNKLLLDIRKVLKINCKLIIGVPGIKGYASDADHKIFYDRKKLINLLEKYSFELEDDFYAPINSIYFNDKLRQFCLYAIFKKK